MRLQPQIKVGNIYWVRLKGDELLGTMVEVLGIGANQRGFSGILLQTYNFIGAEPAPLYPAQHPATRRYFCSESFIEQRDWPRIGFESRALAQPTEHEATIWGTYDLFLDELRQQLGLPRLKYTGAQFAFASKCDQCGGPLRRGFARCPACRALRLEFAGWEHCVVDIPGAGCLSNAETDVKAPDGKYYWAPYFIDLVQAGKFGTD